MSYVRERSARSVTPVHTDSNLGSPHSPSTPVRVVEYCGKKKLVWTASPTSGGAATASSTTTALTQSSDELHEGILHYLFLPKGYPETVTDDYIKYQFWDTLQALFSAITGLLATRAVFVGVGVGDAAATSAAATLQWICKDGVSSVGRILFASAISKQLDSDSKRWRLVADLTNDLGIFLEILSGYVSHSYFLPLICLSAAFRTICGVCAGITRACLTFHFAKVQNTADIASKDGNQETAVSLTGLVLGALVTLIPDSPALTWGLFFLFTACHIACNYLGVRAVVLRVVNRHRLELSLRNDFPTPYRVSRLEGILFYSTLNITLGAKLSDVVTTSADLAALSRSAKPWRCARKNGRVHVALRKDSTPSDELMAYSEAFLMLERGASAAEAEMLVHQINPLKRLQANGWEMENILLNAGEFRYEV